MKHKQKNINNIVNNNNSNNNNNYKDSQSLISSHIHLQKTQNEEPRTDYPNTQLEQLLNNDNLYYQDPYIYYVLKTIKGEWQIMERDRPQFKHDPIPLYLQSQSDDDDDVEEGEPFTTSTLSDNDGNDEDDVDTRSESSSLNISMNDRNINQTSKSKQTQIPALNIRTTIDSNYNNNTNNNENHENNNNNIKIHNDSSKPNISFKLPLNTINSDNQESSNKSPDNHSSTLTLSPTSVNKHLSINDKNNNINNHSTSDSSSTTNTHIKSSKTSSSSSSVSSMPSTPDIPETPSSQSITPHSSSHINSQNNTPHSVRSHRRFSINKPLESARRKLSAFRLSSARHHHHPSSSSSSSSSSSLSASHSHHYHFYHHHKNHHKNHNNVVSQVVDGNEHAEEEAPLSMRVVKSNSEGFYSVRPIQPFERFSEHDVLLRVPCYRFMGICKPNFQWRPVEEETMHHHFYSLYTPYSEQRDLPLIIGCRNFEFKTDFEPLFYRISIYQLPSKNKREHRYSHNLSIDNNNPNNSNNNNNNNIENLSNDNQFEAFSSDADILNLNEPEKLTEDFYFHNLDEETIDMFSNDVASELRHSKKMQRALFRIPHSALNDKENIIAVVSVEHLYQGALDKIVPFYQNGEHPGSEDQRIISALASNPATIRQTLFWGFFPLFQGEETRDRISLRELYVSSLDNFMPHSIPELILDADQDRNNLKQKHEHIACKLEMEISHPTLENLTSVTSEESLVSSPDSPSINSSLPAFNYSSPKLSIETKAHRLFPVVGTPPVSSSSSPSPLPNLRFTHSLYVYPLKLKGKSLARHAQNVFVRVFLRSSDNDIHFLTNSLSQILCPFHPSSHTAMFGTCVTHHNRMPFFFDEVKIDLPLPTPPQLHLVFEFCHVRMKKTRKTIIKKGIPAVEYSSMGFAVTQILNDDSTARFMIDGEHRLRVTRNLAPGYLSRRISSSNLTFSIRTLLSSSIVPKDDHLSKIVFEYNRFTHSVLKSSMPTLERHDSLSPHSSGSNSNSFGSNNSFSKKKKKNKHNNNNNNNNKINNNNNNKKKKKKNNKHQNESIENNTLSKESLIELIQDFRSALKQISYADIHQLCYFSHIILSVLIDSLSVFDRSIPLHSDPQIEKMPRTIFLSIVAVLKLLSSQNRDVNLTKKILNSFVHFVMNDIMKNSIPLLHLITEHWLDSLNQVNQLQSPVFTSSQKLIPKRSRFSFRREEHDHLSTQNDIENALNVSGQDSLEFSGFYFDLIIKSLKSFIVNSSSSSSLLLSSSSSYFQQQSSETHSSNLNSSFSIHASPGGESSPATPFSASGVSTSFSCYSEFATWTPEEYFHHFPDLIHRFLSDGFLPQLLVYARAGSSVGVHANRSLAVFIKDLWELMDLNSVIRLLRTYSDVMQKTKHGVALVAEFFYIVADCSDFMEISERVRRENIDSEYSKQNNDAFDCSSLNEENLNRLSRRDIDRMSLIDMFCVAISRALVYGNHKTQSQAIQYLSNHLTKFDYDQRYRSIEKHEELLSQYWSIVKFISIHNVIESIDQKEQLTDLVIGVLFIISNANNEFLLSWFRSADASQLDNFISLLSVSVVLLSEYTPERARKGSVIIAGRILDVFMEIFETDHDRFDLVERTKAQIRRGMDQNDTRDYRPEKSNNNTDYNNDNIDQEEEKEEDDSWDEFSEEDLNQQAKESVDDLIENIANFIMQLLLTAPKQERIVIWNLFHSDRLLPRWISTLKPMLEKPHSKSSRTSNTWRMLLGSLLVHCSFPSNVQSHSSVSKVFNVVLNAKLTSNGRNSLEKQSNKFKDERQNEEIDQENEDDEKTEKEEEEATSDSTISNSFRNSDVSIENDDYVHRKSSQGSNTDSQDLEFEHNVVYNSDGSVKAASLDYLVRNLVSSSKQERNYLQTFMLTYMSFTTPAEFLDKFLSLLEQLETEVELSKYGNALHKWVHEGFEDFDDNTLARLIHFLDRVLYTSTVQPQIKAVAPRIKNTLQKKLLDIRDRRILLHEEGPPPLLPKGIPRKELFVAKYDWTKAQFARMAEPPFSLPFLIMQWRSEEIARQMTIIEFSLFRKIHPRECFNKGWEKKGKHIRAPNIVKMTERFNRISCWVQWNILRENDLRQRRHLVEKFIRITQHLLDLNNFASANQILSALNTAPLSRLKRTWEGVSDDWKEKLSEWRQLFKPPYIDLKESTQNATSACVPFVGMFQTFLTFIEDGNKDQVYGLINLKKRQQYVDIVQTIQMKQDQPYALQSVPYLQWALSTGIENQSFPSEAEAFAKSKALEPKRTH